MAQFMRPDADTANTTLFTGGWADIDESSASDSDYAYSNPDNVETLEVGLTNPSTPASGTCTVRYRIAKTDSTGAVDGDGDVLTVTTHVYGGETLITSDSARTPTGTWTQYSFTFNTSAVSNWSTLRLRFVTAPDEFVVQSRGVAISWAEIEIPDAAAVSSKSATVIMTGLHF